MATAGAHSSDLVGRIAVRRLLLVSALLVLAGCSKEPEGSPTLGASDPPVSTVATTEVTTTTSSAPTTISTAPSTTSPATTSPAANCEPSYPSVCIPPAPPDLDCKDIPDRRFVVLPPDPHEFDISQDGVGCEGGD